MKKILIVDDEDDVLKVLGKILTIEGYDVIKANNWKDAVESARKQCPALMILDIMMPEKDGGQIVEVLKNYPETKKLPIIFLTGLVTKTEEKYDGHFIGGNFFIAKPYTKDEVLQAVHKYIK